MKRHYYISDDLDDLEVIEHKLETAGVSTPQIHVLSTDDSGVQQRRLNQVEPVLKKDVVKGTTLGAVVGAVGAAAVLLIAWKIGLTETYTWVPAIFLSVIILGFCTWEGGLIGIHNPHADFKRFQADLSAGKHILFVDVDPDQESSLRHVVTAHPKLQTAGEGASTPRWVVTAQNTFMRFMHLAP